MALFFREDGSYDETRRMEGFDRYRQLLGAYALRWMVVNILTTIGVLPLVIGISVAIVTSSVLILLPASLLGGLIFGPFLAALFDSLMRGLRDAPGKWWDHYVKSWRQNTKSALLPGAVTGLVTGVCAFMVYMLWTGTDSLKPGTVLLLLCSLLLFFAFSTLYWPQLVLFEQRSGIRLKNAVLFMIRHSLRVLGAALVELGYVLLIALFMPWTLILVPFFGFWFVLFLAEFLLYEDFNRDFQVEAQFVPVEGAPWAT